MDYPDTITDMLAYVAYSMKWKSYDVDLTEIAAALGCRSWETSYKPQGMSTVIISPPQPDPRYEDLVVEALLEIVRANAASNNDDDISATILDGLLVNDRWRVCLNANIDACRFIGMLALFYLDLYFDNAAENTLRLEMAELVHKILREWLHFEGKQSELTPIAITRLAFGDAWCDIFLAERMPFDDLISTIYAHNPPFLPGLLPSVAGVDEVSLPDMSL